MNPRNRMIAVGVVLPVLIALVALVAVFLLVPQLPDPIATHWGPTGTVDGYGPAWATAILPLVVVAGYSVLALVVISGAGERVTVLQKLLLATAPFLAAMVATVSAGSVLIQRGLATATDAPSVVPVVLVALAAAAVLAFLGWLLLPKASPPSAAEPQQLPDLALATTARATWVRRAEPTRGLAVVIVLILVLGLVVGTVALWAAAPLGFLLGYVLTMLLLVILVAAGLSWRVTVDRRGFRAVSLLGWPRFVYPLSTLRSATVVTVSPIGDFGGWGLRWAGRWGVVLRAGEALQVTRTNNRTFVVTVPDAQTGARLLNALVDRVE